MAIDLTGRLLCASSQAYAITGAGPVPMTSPRAGLVGWLKPPEGYVTGDDAIDAAMVGSTANEIIVAFRGTLPPDSPNRRQMILDWADDLDAPLVADPNLPGLVHQGFRDCLDLLWPMIEPQIAELLAVRPARPIYVTGHSKGGAVAFLAGWRCRQSFPAALTHVCTFAAARCGDIAFASAYNAALPQTARFEYADDIVPHLPPSLAFATMFAGLPFWPPSF
jgi:predicted lipase